MEPKKYEYIDSLRGIAVIVVVLVHVLLSNLPVWQYFPEVLQYSMPRIIHCIQLFFIVSAFTLTISYYSRKNEKNATLNFLIRRFFRVAPMYYIAIVYFTFDQFLGFNFTEMNLSDVPLKGLVSSILFLNGLFPAWINSYVPGGWTVTVEFMFYFTMPFICRYINNLDKSIIFVLVTLLFSSLLNYVLADSSFDKYDFLYYYFPNQLPVFALGILTYWLLNSNLNSIKANTWLFIIIIVAFYSYVSVPSHVLDAFLFLLLILLLNKCPYRFISNKLFANIGKCSFSLYLIHFALLSFFTRLDILEYGFLEVNSSFMALLNFLILYILVLGCSFIIAHFTYKYIEVPGQNIGRKLIKKLNNQ